MANESSGKKALKAGLGYTVGNMLVKGLFFLAIPLFARLMTVEDFGIYSTFSSYVMIMTVLAGFTLHTSVRNAKLDYVDLTGSYCSSVTLLVIGNSLLLLDLSLVFASPLARSLSLEQPYLPALIVLESFGMAMLTFYNSVLSVDYKYKEYLVLSLVYAVAGIGGSVLLAELGLRPGGGRSAGQGSGPPRSHRGLSSADRLRLLRLRDLARGSVRLHPPGPGGRQGLR